jgi:uncharacterized OB-fold protein
MSEIEQKQQAFEAKLQEWVGDKEGPPYVCPDRVGESMIRHWCEAMGDTNPVYLDPAAAKQSVHGGIVAPPTMLQCWDMRGFPMHDASLLPQNRQRLLHAYFDEHGYTGVVATDTEQEFTRYLRPGDQVSSETTIESISEQKATALGVGYFIVTRTIFRDGDGEQVGWLTFRVLKFKPSAQPAAAAGDGPAASSTPVRIRSPRGHDNGWWWEGLDEGRLLIQQCNECTTLRHPPRPMCGKCQSTNWGSIEASGKGVVHSFTILHHPMVPGYEFPCPVALIDLEEGTRLVANVRGCKPEDIHIDMKVECMFEDTDENMKLPFFYPALKD